MNVKILIAPARPCPHIRAPHGRAHTKSQRQPLARNLLCEQIMMQRTTNWLMIPSLSLGLALGACSGADIDIPPPGQLAKSDVERDLAPSVAPAEAQELVAGNTAFAIDAYHQLIQPGDNLFYSPLSVSIALAMTYGGARTDTEVQMAEALHYTLPQAQLHPAFNWLDLELGSRGQGARGADGKAFRLNVTNATFGQVGYEFLPSYLDLLALNYGAGMSLLDFMADPEAARKEINDWVAARTENKIPELLPQGIIKPDTRLVLTNAVYFNAAWKTPFEPEGTANLVFHAPGGDVTVPTMRGEIGDLKGASGPDYQAVSLPYDGDELDMVIIMPDQDAFAAFEASFDAAVLQDILGALGPSGYGALRMPRFEFRSQADMVPVLRSLGMEDAFTESADFSGMDGARNLMITAIQHEAFVKVNEAGTEAAAATGVVAGPTSAPLELAIDRPFLFLIRDIETGAIIFLGRVLDPSAS
jgi:serpin B